MCVFISVDAFNLPVNRLLRKKSLTDIRGPISLSESDDPFLLNNMESITVCDEGTSYSVFNLTQSTFVQVYAWGPRPISLFQLSEGSDKGAAVLPFGQVKLNVYVYQV